VVYSAIAQSVSSEKSRNDSSSQMFDFLRYSTSDERDLLVMEGYVPKKLFVDNLTKQNLQMIFERFVVSKSSANCLESCVHFSHPKMVSLQEAESISSPRRQLKKRADLRSDNFDEG
jgi:hypothetical protein